jgi:hypothetical protein
VSLLIKIMHWRLETMFSIENEEEEEENELKLLVRAMHEN